MRYAANNPANVVDPLGLTPTAALGIFAAALARAGAAEAVGLGPENPVADAVATGLLLYGAYQAWQACNQDDPAREGETPNEKACPRNGPGATNPNTPDPDNNNDDDKFDPTQKTRPEG